MHAKTNRALPALGLLAALLSATLPTTTAAATPAAAAGEIMLLTGRGTAINPADGGIRELAKGDAIFPGEIVNSSANSYINIKFADGSFILLRPKTRFQIEAYQFEAATAAVAPPPAAPAAVEPPGAAVAKPAAPKPAPAAPAAKPAPAPPSSTAASTPASATPAPTGSRAFFKLIKGGFRAVSGLIGKVEHNDYRVTTPVATIGIRGTDSLLVLCDLACNSDPVLRDSLPEGSSADGGLVVGVISGGVFVANEAGKEVLLSENQYLINLPDGTQIMLPFEPRFLKVDPIPNPLGMCE